MALPNPLPDNPTRWDGWKHYDSADYYARLCLSFDSNPSADQIEDNCRQLLVWWQKKLPLKNQPSNPLSQMLRGGMDEAPKFLAEARTVLLDPEARAKLDQELHERAILTALEEFKKLLAFAISENQLRDIEEQRLYERGRGLGLGREEMQAAVDAELEKMGAERIGVTIVAPTLSTAAPVSPEREIGDPFSEFRKLMRMSRLCLEGEEMTDDQRDAMCNLGESLGLTGGQAEDLIDEYLEEVSGLPTTVQPAAPIRGVAIAPPKPAMLQRPVPAPVVKKPETPVVAKVPVAMPSQLGRAQERVKYPNFTNVTGMEMQLVTSGIFVMGSNAREAQPNEQPLTKVTVSCLYVARFPVTNAQFELFDPAHKNKRSAWANDSHPVVYVSSRDAEKFCQWLSAKEGRKYRLPSEAEWEYAARGLDGRTYPWGERLDSGLYANFADARTGFAWKDLTIDDGFSETSPVGSFPKGASPFGIEDLAGNVFEWCLDCFENYKGKDRVDPKGLLQGAKRNYRGGSWKSRSVTLRTTARAFNQPDYLSNDVGFRVVCECVPV